MDHETKFCISIDVLQKIEYIFVHVSHIVHPFVSCTGLLSHSLGFIASMRVLPLTSVEPGFQHLKFEKKDLTCFYVLCLSTCKNPGFTQV